MNKSYYQAINEAIYESMKIDKSVICYGLGVTDPKGVFGTTLNLEDKFGSDRVFDMPTSENALTGIAIGASLNGIKPLVTHQRLDFFLLAMDQLVNSASKYYYMFGSQISVPITIRLIVGRGWGQGPTHSQNLQSWFAHIPGIKVIMPSSAKDAKGLLLSAIFDPNPTIFLEHRWLHHTEGKVPKGVYKTPIGSAKILKKGSDLTIISMSYMTLEAIKACDYLEKNGVFCELVDLRTISPLDWSTVFKSVKKTGRLLVLDTGFSTCSVASEIVSKVTINLYDKLKAAPDKLAMPDVPEPTSHALTKNFYNTDKQIVEKVNSILGCKVRLKNNISKMEYHDVPNKFYKGPF